MELGFSTHTGQIENYWLADHAHHPAATLPLLVMDMYEHSYQMDYGAAAGKYIGAFFQNIRWDAVASRLEAAKRLHSGVWSVKQKGGVGGQNGRQPREWH